MKLARYSYFVNFIDCVYFDKHIINYIGALNKATPHKLNFQNPTSINNNLIVLIMIIIQFWTLLSYWKILNCLELLSVLSETRS